MKGYIRKRGRAWELFVELPSDRVTGTRRRQTRTVNGTKKEAQRLLTELMQQVNTGALVSASPHTTLGEFLPAWLAYKATQVRPVTLRRYRGITERNVIPHLGDVPIVRMEPHHLLDLYAKLSKEGRRDGKAGGLSEATLTHVHRLLSQALRDAVRWGQVGRNVAQAVKPPRPAPQELRALDSDGVNRLLGLAKELLYYPAIELAAGTGLRRSEVLGLQWGDIDLMLMTLSVRRVLHQMTGGKFDFRRPKTPKSQRLVTLTPYTTMMLRTHRERQEELLGGPVPDDRLVFSDPDGTPWRPDTLSHVFGRIARKAGLEGVRLHDLRHAHATLMLKDGIHPKVVSERLGHSTISITLDIYSHVLPGLQEEAAKRFDNILGRSPEELPVHGGGRQDKV